MLPLPGAQVQYLVGELRSHKVHGVAKKKKKSNGGRKDSKYEVYIFGEIAIETETEERKTYILHKNPLSGTSLVAQWLRIHLPMQGTQV